MHLATLVLFLYILPLSFSPIHLATLSLPIHLATLFLFLYILPLFLFLYILPLFLFLYILPLFFSSYTSCHSFSSYTSCHSLALLYILPLSFCVVCPFHRVLLIATDHLLLKTPLLLSLLLKNHLLLVTAQTLRAH